MNKTKIYLLIGLVVLFAGLIIFLVTAVKSCTRYKTLSIELKKEKELVIRIQRRIIQSDERTNQNERTQILVIRNTPDNALVHELNRLFKNDNQTRVYPASGQTHPAGSQISTGSERNTTRQH